MKQNNQKSFHLSDLLWDAWCVGSIVGIWPRFIEPQLLSYTKLRLKIDQLPFSLKGLKVVQFSDLHIQANLSDRFLDRLAAKLMATHPDILVFTGDFLCYSQLNEDQTRRLHGFLNKLSAKYGCYAILGNHDYAGYVSINEQGDYDILKEETDQSLITRGFQRLFSKTQLTKQVTPAARSIGLHNGLTDLLVQTPFKLLHNASCCIPIGDDYLNICGLGEYCLGKTDPQKAFSSYNPNYPGIILLHNPDGIPLLDGYPGDIILCGHTHGGQVNLPWMWKKFTLMENSLFKRGLIHHHNKWVYINRGIGSIFRFRWFAVPEILQLTLY